MTVQDYHLIPETDESTEFFATVTVLFTLDAQSGYWPPGIADKERDKTELTLHQGLFRLVKEWLFVFQTAPQTFQSGIDLMILPEM